MKASAKARAALERRRAFWDNLAATGQRGTTVKLVRRNDGNGSTAFVRPGSQNRKKGASIRRSARH